MFKEYEEKLLRRNARIVAFWKWRFVFLGTFLLLVALTVLLGLTGSVMDIEAAANYEYGDPPVFSGSALFSEVSFRYRTPDGDWTEEAPIDAGDYEVQAVSHGLAGKPRYGKVKPFTIAPVPIKVKITDAEVDFGNLPQSVTADNLKYGDKLAFGDFEIEYHDRTADVAPEKEGLRITDENDKDVTFNYDITVETKTIICNPVNATVTTPDGSWVYDGKEHRESDVTAQGLLPGHILGDVQTSAVIDKGSCENEVDCRIFDEGGNDVTVHYMLEKRLGTLTVTARPVTVTTAGLSAVYDGTEHTLSNDPSGDLAPGHVFVYQSKTTTLKTVEKKENSVDFVIEDAGGQDVTNNYTVTEKFGVLEVEKRKITIRTESEDIVYDGKPHSNTKLSVDNIAEGQSVVYSGWKSLTAVGAVTNDIKYVIRDASGADVSGQYAITEEFGALTVTVRPVTVTTAGLSAVYDGTEHTLSNDPSGDLAPGHVFVYQSKTITLKSVEKGENSVEFVIEDAGGQDVTDNYSVTKQFGTFEIKKRPLTIKTGSASKEYDGKPLSCTAYDDPNSVKIDGLADGEKICAPFDNDFLMTNITEVGDTLNTFVPYYKIYAGDVETTPNYDIDEQWGTLTVEPYVIYVQSKDVVFTYNGEKHKENGDSLNGPPVNGHTLKLKWPQLTDAGSVPNIPETCTVEAAGEDVTRNYSFDYEHCGTLTVKPRVINVTTESGEFVFDGNPKYVHNYEQHTALLNKHRIYSYETTVVTDVTDHDGRIGYVENKIKFSIKETYSGRDVSDNYTTEPMGGTWGKIRIKAPIVVRLSALSKVYDGTELAYKPTDWRVESLPVGIESDWLKIELVGALTNVGTLGVDIVRSQSNVRLVNGEGKDLLPANRVDFVGEPLTVHARPLIVNSASARMLCEGKTLYGNDIPHPAWISFGALLKDHKVEFKVTGSLKPDQFTASNTVAVRIFNGNDDVTDCYDIQYRYGTLSWL